MHTEERAYDRFFDVLDLADRRACDRLLYVTYATRAVTMRPNYQAVCANLILMTVICVGIFMLFMAIGPSQSPAAIHLKWPAASAQEINGDLQFLRIYS
jgi:hypothetical protein